MIRIPADSDIDMDVTIEMVSGGVYISALAQAQTVGECARCLGSLHGNSTIRIDELYVDPDSVIAQETDPDDDDLNLIEDDYIDLSQPLIDAVGLALPWSPTCDIVMGTECVNKEIPRPDGVAGEEAPRVDIRWAALGDLYGSPDTAVEKDSDDIS